MEYFYEAAKNCVDLFKRNVKAEYEADLKLRDACASFVGSYIEYRDAIKGSKPFIIGNKIIGSSIGAMKVSDAFIKFYFEAFRLPRLSFGISGLLRDQSKVQRKLDMMFVIPQYYGGIKDSNILSYGKLYKEMSKTPKVSKATALDVYKPTMRKKILNLVSKLKSVFDFGGQEDSIAAEIENCLLPKIFRSVDSRQELLKLCSEEGALDLKQLMAEVRREFGGEEMDLKIADLRRVETSGASIDGDETCFKSQFEIEIEATCGRTYRRSIYIFLCQGKFISRGERSRNAWKLSGLTWSRLN